MKKNIYHTPLESGLRVLFILEEYHPRSLDLDEILKLDHTTKFGCDINKKNNLYPISSITKSEIMINRRLIHDGIKLLGSYNLIKINIKDSGYFYTTSDDAPAFIKKLNSTYYLKLRNKVSWVKKSITI